MGGLLKRLKSGAPGDSGHDMATTWPRHGHDMATTWPSQGLPGRVEALPEDGDGTPAAAPGN